MTKVIMAGITPFIVMILLSAFVQWNLDVSTWSDDLRYLCACVGVLVGGFLSAVMYSCLERQP